jgi:hypothetical protein
MSAKRKDTSTRKLNAKTIPGLLEALQSKGELTCLCHEPDRAGIRAIASFLGFSCRIVPIKPLDQSDFSFEAHFFKQS